MTDINVSLAAPETITVTLTSIDSTSWDHSTLSNLDYASAGHTDFAGTTATQTLTNKTLTDAKISGKIYLDYASDTYLEYISGEVFLYVGGNIAASW